MKKRWFPGIFLFFFLVSCLDPDLPHINGMWQLKTIVDEKGNVQAVDTIYYSFQRQAVFSYTVLNANPANPDPTELFYGYIDFPAENKLHILIDEKYIWEASLALMLWHDRQTTYDILKLNSKELILGQDGTQYNFIKF
ncbi:hypothetical protein FACS189437_10130 [Bacteroidia bacterium]|nr:hypothetical protein FACS189437_10130 [Bacteroidia bacterium]